MSKFPLILLALLTATGAEAGLSVCNKSQRTAKVALGRFDGRDWRSEGWWSIASGACAALVPGKLDARYYYLYGSDGDTAFWDGGTWFCTADGARFQIEGRGNCAARGYDRRRFFRVDTGDNLNQVLTLQ
ncbi:MAG: DUF1036 domain-containing protein [Alphaproteobacteria bacterium]|nr:DUF1036 domain-containing protein [Alphaproteobacteria bacterium]MBV9692689.1 DUF1036 domain-containing protein [Alphaproteobacteria bacterium]